MLHYRQLLDNYQTQVHKNLQQYVFFNEEYFGTNFISVRRTVPEIFDNWQHYVVDHSWPLGSQILSIVKYLRNRKADRNKICAKMFLDKKYVLLHIFMYLRSVIIE